MDTLMIIIKTKPIALPIPFRFQIYIYNCMCLYLYLFSLFNQIISPPVDAEEISLVSQREGGLCYGPSAKQDEDVCS